MSASHEHPNQMSLMITLAALLLLTVISYLLAGHFSPEWEMLVALSIAAVKVMLVAMIFMNLRRAPLIFIITLLVLLLTTSALVGLISSDVAMRADDMIWYRYDPGN